MKRYGIMFALGVVLVSLILALGAGASHDVAPVRQVVPTASIPQFISYQGRVTVGGNPFNGTGYFKFAIARSNSAGWSWSNDGSASCFGCEPDVLEPVTSVPIIVNSGYFTHELGSTNAIAADVFDYGLGYLMLRVWFSTDNVTFEELLPNTPFASVPYAFRAERIEWAGIQNAPGTATPQPTSTVQPYIAYTNVANVFTMTQTINSAPNSTQFIIKAAPTQSANLFETQNSSSQSYVEVNSTGILNIRQRNDSGDYIAIYGKSGGSFKISDQGGSATNFGPAFTAVNYGDSVQSLRYISAIYAANDSGTTPVVSFEAMLNTGAVVITRPLFSFKNYNTSVASIWPDGTMLISTTTKSAGAAATVGGSIVPAITATYDLGSSALAWNQVHAKAYLTYSYGDWTNGVKLQTGETVSCAEAIARLRPSATATVKTSDGIKAHLDYGTLPAAALVKGQDEWQMQIKRADKSDQAAVSSSPIYDDQGRVIGYDNVYRVLLKGQDGADMDVMQSIMLCASRELDAKAKTIEARLAAIEKALSEIKGSKLP